MEKRSSHSRIGGLARPYQRDPDPSRHVQDSGQHRHIRDSGLYARRLPVVSPSHYLPEREDDRSYDQHEESESDQEVAAHRHGANGCALVAAEDGAAELVDKLT